MARRFIVFNFIFFISVLCKAAVFDPDTIDNWQIYNGDSLILSGNIVTTEYPEGIPTATLKFTKLNSLRIRYNTDAPSAKGKLSIWILVPSDKPIGVKKEFTKSLPGSYTFTKEDLKNLPVDLSSRHRSSIKIWYGVNENTLGICMGEIFLK